MESILSSLFTYLGEPFVQRAFIIGIIVALLSSFLSVYIVLKRLSLIGDGLAHSAYGGLAIGLAVGLYPTLICAGIVILASLGMTKAIRSGRLAGDAAVAVFLELGLATGVFVTSVTLNYGYSLDSLLFGSILLVSWPQIYTASVVLAATLFLTFVFYKQMLYTVFDQVQAQAGGVVTWRMDYLLSVLTGIAVVAAIPIVGILLISSLVLLPGLISVQIARSFKQTFLMAPVFGLASVVFGLIFSITVPNAAPGGAIVLVALAMLIAVMSLKSLKSFFRL
jgi:zinc transport system permease protein